MLSLRAWRMGAESMSSKWVKDSDPLIDPLIRLGEDGATMGAAVREM